MKCRIEDLAIGGDLRNSVLGERSEDLPKHQLDAIKDCPDLFTGILRPMLEGAFQIIDRRKKILDEILVPELEALIEVAGVNKLRGIASVWASNLHSSTP